MIEARFLVANLLFGALPALAGADSFDHMHGSVRRAGDVDGDGIPDLLVSSASAETPERVWVFSGKDGSVLLTLTGKTPGDGFGCSIDSAGDVDRDGSPDVLVGALGGRTVRSGESLYRFKPKGRGYARVHSGKDGRILLHFELEDGPQRFGFSVAGAGDVDGDGWPDALVGAPGGNGRFPSFVRVHSGRDGRVLLRMDCAPREPNELCTDDFGSSVSGCGDLDGDGHADFVVGNPGTPKDSMRGGLLRAFSGKEGKVLFTATGEATDEEFGWVCSVAGDVDRDGLADILVSAPNTYVGILSGKTGTPLPGWTKRRKSHILDFYGSTVDTLGDLNGDGVPDVIAGANESLLQFFDHGFANVYSGKDGSILHHFGFYKYGLDVCGLGDVNSDGVPDMALSSPEHRGVKIVSGKDFSDLRHIAWPAVEQAEAPR